VIATDLRIFGNGDWDAAQRHGSKYIEVWESTDLVHWSAHFRRAAAQLPASPRHGTVLPITRTELNRLTCRPVSLAHVSS
jgi:hypothetical protein